jgi:hypothetical protein
LQLVFRILAWLVCSFALLYPGPDTILRTDQKELEKSPRTGGREGRGVTDERREEGPADGLSLVPNPQRGACTSQLLLSSFAVNRLRVMASQSDSRGILCLFLAIPSAVTPFDECPVGW